jgi:hypothetical protein
MVGAVMMWVALGVQGAGVLTAMRHHLQENG